MVGMKQMAEQPRQTHSERPVLIIGWMEYVDLPDLGLLDLHPLIEGGVLLLLQEVPINERLVIFFESNHLIKVITH